MLCTGWETCTYDGVKRDASLVYLAPEGRHVYSTGNGTAPQAPAGRHVL